MIPRDEVLSKLSYSHKYFTNRKGDKSPTSCLTVQNNIQPLSKDSQNLNAKDLTDQSFFSCSSKIPESLFKKLRMIGSADKEKPNDTIQKLKQHRDRRLNKVNYLR